MDELDVMNPVQSDQDEEPANFGESEQENTSQPFDEIGENVEIEVSDGENNMAELGDKVDPFTPILEETDTYYTSMEVHVSAIEDFCSQQLELLQGIYINQLFFIGCTAAVLVVLVLYNFLRKFF